MSSSEHPRVVVTGGSRGLGLGIVEALVAKKAHVTVLARDAARLAELKRRSNVDTIAGDATDRPLARATLASIRPDILVLNAGAMPGLGPIHEQTWEEFSVCWENDVKAGFVWVQEALKLPLPRGSRVLIVSSGAAVGGSPLSGGYSAAKRMLWLMASYASGVATERDLGVRFQAVLPMQIVVETDLGRRAAEAYAARKGVTLAAFLANFGKPMSPREYGDHVATILFDPKHADAVAFGIKGETGVSKLEG